MRRTALSSLVPLMLAATLAVGLAPTSAVAGPRLPDLPSASAASLPAGLRQALDRLHGTPARRGGTLSALRGQFRVPDSPYRWGFTVVHIGDRFFLFVFGEESLSNGIQTHSWTFRLPVGSVAIGSRLRRAHIHTGEAMGPFGSIDLSFHSARRLRTRSSRCPTTHELLGQDRSRRGVLTGSFELTPNEGTLPTLAFSRIRGVAERETETGHRCPGGGGRRSCAVGKTVSVHDAADGTEVLGYFSNRRSEQLIATQHERIGPAVLTHDIVAFASGPPVMHLGPSGLSIDASALSPLASGSLAFEAGGTTRHRGPLCRIARTKEVWSSGTLTVDFDSGAIDLTRASLRSSAVERTRR